MSKILICTIIRNEARHMDRWYAQLKRTVELMPEHEFHFSVYENDSTDDSKQKLNSYDFEFFHSYSVANKKLKVHFFEGGKHPARVNLLAFVRNETMRNCAFLDQMDFVLWCEPDTEFDHSAVERIINHEKHYGIKADVFTGKSVHPNSHGIYDSWGTRKTPDQSDWKDGDEDGYTGGVMPMWSTFNCLVIYNAEPIKKGIMFGGVNPRWNVSDCDTCVIVENFRLNGYDKIYWAPEIEVTHFCN